MKRTSEVLEGVLESPTVTHELLPDDGNFPNNQDFPLLIYQNAIDLSTNDPASMVERIFHKNRWGGLWRNGIYGFHHYHSTAHEVLGIYGGRVKVQLGGPDGITVTAEKGDVIVIPAGAAHKNLESSADFRCVGAYPRGQSWDMNYGKSGERPRADNNIAKVPLPEMDPVYGQGGPLEEHWFGGAE